MGCAKGLTILFSVLVLLKGLAGLLIGILSLTVPIITAFLLVILLLGFGIGIQSVSSQTDGVLDVSGLLARANLLYGLIAIGAVGLFVGIWGIVAAAKKNRCMLTTGAIILFILLAAEVIITVFTGLGYAHFTSRLTKAEFDKTSGGIKGDYMNTAQTYFSCCGIDGPADYGVIPTDIPIYCCIPDDAGGIETAKCQAKLDGFIYKDGCGQYKGQIPGPFWTPLGVLIALSAISLFTFIISIAFCCTLRKDEYA